MNDEVNSTREITARPWDLDFIQPSKYQNTNRIDLTDLVLEEDLDSGAMMVFESLVADLDIKGNRKAKATLLTYFRCILANIQKGKLVRISLNNDTFPKVGDTAKNPHGFYYKKMTNILNSLQKMGFIELIKGFLNRNFPFAVPYLAHLRSQSTKFGWTKQFKTLLASRRYLTTTDLAEFKRQIMRENVTKEVTKKDKNGKERTYKKVFKVEKDHTFSLEAHHMEAILTRHENLMKQCIVFTDKQDDGWIFQTDKNGDIRSANVHNIRLQQIFLEDETKCGRLFAPYMGLSKEIRKLLKAKIFGNTLEFVSLDFKTLHPVILATWEGYKVDHDIYGIAKTISQFTDAQWRKLVKIITNKLINGTGAGGFAYTINEYAHNEGVTGFVARGEDAQAIIDAILDLNPFLAPYVGQGIGTRLQNIETRIILEVIDHFTAKWVPTLPVHDCIMIPTEYQEECRKVMLQAACAVVGVVSDNFKIEVE